MRIYRLVGLLTVLVNGGAFAAPPSTQPAAADGVPFPPFGPRRVELKLPYVGNVLGATPDELAKGRVFSLASHELPVRGWKQQLVQHKVDPSEYEWVARNVAGADLCLFTLTDGRVSKVGMLYPRLVKSRADDMMLAWRTLGKVEEGGSDAFVVQADKGLRLIASVSGSHEDHIPGKFHTGTIGGAKGYRDPDTIVEQPSFVTIGVHGLDWYCLHNDLPADRADAIRAGRLTKGMTKLQALLAKRNYEHVGRESTSGGVDRIVWYGTVSDRITLWYASSSFYSTSVAVITRQSIDPAAEAEFRDDALVSFREH